MIYLDTHVAAWLFAGEHRRLSAAGRRAVEEHGLLVSPALSTRVLVIRLSVVMERGDWAHSRCTAQRNETRHDHERYDEAGDPQ